MSRMAEECQQQEQENLSGLNNQSWFVTTWHENNRKLLDGFDNIRPIIQGKQNEQSGNTECAKTPF